MAMTAVAAAVAVTATSLAASPAAAAPTGTTASRPGDSRTAADLGTRHPYIKTTEVSPTITHFKGWYVTEGTTGNQTVTTSTQTTITVSVGLNNSIEGGFASETLGKAGVSVGLNVKAESSSTSTESNSVAWNFNQAGYYGVYKGTKKVTGTYGSLNCNRVQQNDGSWALKWIEGSEGGSFTTYTTLEEGAVAPTATQKHNRHTQPPATERGVLRTLPCAEDDLQRFYIYRDVPGSPKIGVQNKYTGSMMGHDRYADGEFLRQYSSGRQDGAGTYNLTTV
ncbi:hypothetical protein [Streptomyces sp. NRRL B-1347]|uniref:hypothetical protein n=1 Tax=Streptomyces sp. NRRL B-1347 TaxID=1476877 RepID=UPI0018FE8002|nr:hypothetical protein [Streptomyces sp. NRRL B-1347]